TGSRAPRARCSTTREWPRLFWAAGDEPSPNQARPRPKPRPASAGGCGGADDGARPRPKPRPASAGGCGGPCRGPPRRMIQALADGILTGAIIALGAIGVTFTLGIMRFANFAHSELLTWGAYIALVIVTFAGPGTPTGPLSFGWQLLAAALIAAVLTGLVAWAVD